VLTSKMIRTSAELVAKKNDLSTRRSMLDAYHADEYPGGAVFPSTVTDVDCMPLPRLVNGRQSDTYWSLVDGTTP